MLGDSRGDKKRGKEGPKKKTIYYEIYKWNRRNSNEDEYEEDGRRQFGFH